MLNSSHGRREGAAAPRTLSLLAEPCFATCLPSCLTMPLPLLSSRCREGGCVLHIHHQQFTGSKPGWSGAPRLWEEGLCTTPASPRPASPASQLFSFVNSWFDVLTGGGLPVSLPQDTMDVDAASPEEVSCVNGGRVAWQLCASSQLLAWEARLTPTLARGPITASHRHHMST